MTSEWGPRLWRILHVLAERHTTPSYNVLIIAFIENLQHVLPCAVCQKHCREYWIAHQIRGPVVMPVVSGRIYRGAGGRGAAAVSSLSTWDPHLLRDWVWSFHNAVTERRYADASGEKVPFVPFPKESLTPMYGDIAVGEDIDALCAYFTRQAMQMRIKSAPLQVFKAQIDRLRVVYGLDSIMRRTDTPAS